MQSEAKRLYGTDEPVAPVRELRAGPLTLELQGARLRRIRCGADEVWHGLAFVLRDADWGTPAATIDRVDLHEDGDAFEARIEGRFEGHFESQSDGAARVRAALPFTLRLTGDARGCITVAATALPSEEVLVNRVGLCLLHPSSVSGAAVEVLHTDGRRSLSTWPTLIPPWPPFTLVRALRHEWAAGHWAQADLEGDVFETEDQRNNGDASFKTYSRSNMAPRPYVLHAGVAIRQRVVLRVESLPHAPAMTTTTPTATPTTTATRTAAPVATPLSVTVGAGIGTLPPVGIEIMAADAQIPALLDELRALRPAHLHMAVRPGADVDWRGVAAMQSAAGAALRLDLFEHTTAGLHALAAALGAAGINPESVAVFPGHHAQIEAARKVFGAGVRLGGGTPHFFVQLSRLDAHAFASGEVDFASFTTASVVHGADDDDVMHGLASLPAMLATWRARHPTLPLRAGPNAIAARSSPLGAQPTSDGTRRIALAAVDPRSGAQFGAAWALGHVAAWAYAGTGLQAISLMSLTGASGVVSWDGKVATRRPAFEVLAALGTPAEMCAVTVSDPQRIAALALMRAGQLTTHIANLGAAPVVVDVGGRTVRLDAYAVAALSTPTSTPTSTAADSRDAGT